MYPVSKFVIEPSQDVNTELLKNSKTSLQELMLAARAGLTLTASIDGTDIAVSITVPRGGHYELVYFMVDPDYRHLGYGKELLLHTLDYVRLLGGEHVEAGAGNANAQMFLFFQRVGFRVVGVERDYFTHGGASPKMENFIANRDMIRYHADLEALYSRR